MSKLVIDKNLNQVQLVYGEDELLGTFQLLDCDECGGTSHHFTDKSGSDNCLNCIESMIQRTISPKYEMPFGDIEKSLEQLTIRATKPEEN